MNRCFRGQDGNARPSYPDHAAHRLLDELPRNNAIHHGIEHGHGWSEARGLSKDGAKKGLKPTHRVNILEIDARESRTNVGNNLRRLGVLLGQPSKGGSEQPESPSPLLIKELLPLGAAITEEAVAWYRCGRSNSAHHEPKFRIERTGPWERADDERPQGAAAEMCRWVEILC